MIPTEDTRIPTSGFVGMDNRVVGIPPENGRDTSKKD